MNVAVTGSAGLLGWHTKVNFSLLTEWEVTGIDRSSFEDDAILTGALTEADVIVHLAGANRGTDSEVAGTNIALAERLAEKIVSLGRPVQVVYSSSTHEESDSPYGKSKRRAGEILTDACEKVGGGCAVMIFPHLFGEQGKPFYNSVVSTFCHQVSQGEAISVNSDGALELLHCQDAADKIREVILQKTSGKMRISGEPMTVSELADKLKAMWKDYDGIKTIPSLASLIDTRLFNTLRSYAAPSDWEEKATVNSDDRGWLFETVRERSGGQAFISSTKPGITRGNHSHRHKVERFLVVQGEATIAMRRLQTEEVVEFHVGGENPSWVDIPTLWTHNITNTGNTDLLTLFWVNELFDPEAPDTYFEQV